ncbi:hypothetical protein DRE_07609 [Drechslerella stenobrocha 248]|uniref:Peptidase A1 domain-containing protein n=1 Tax=Drechslerella stenobrocha 248 TaxID=1043628 RepID=W7HU00_9PEZI|nr:hypothetical protein DRE_07609 [Drechslerella stenobrocha 248]
MMGVTTIWHGVLLGAFAVSIPFSECLSLPEWRAYNSGSEIQQAKALVKRAVTDPILVQYSRSEKIIFTTVQVGSQGDNLLRLRLAASPWLWVGSEDPSLDCTATELTAIQCYLEEFSGTFDPSQSGSFRNLSNSRLAISSSETLYARGYYGTDNLRIGDTMLRNVYVGVAQNFTLVPSIGIGIYDDDKQTYPSFMQSLLQSNEIQCLAHGLYLGNFDRNESSVTLGAVDTAKYEGNLITFNSTRTSDITTLKLLSAAYGTEGNMEELPNIESIDADIAFTYNRLALPDPAAEAILRTTEAEYNSTINEYIVDCALRTSGPSFEFRFRDVNITVGPSQYIIPAFDKQDNRYVVNGADACALLIRAMTSYGNATTLGFQAVLGAPFVRHAYLVHDYTNRQLSMAPAKLNTTETNIVALDSRGPAPLFVPSGDAGPSPPVGGAPAPEPTKAGPNTGAIAGGVVGGVVGIAGLVLLVFFLTKRRRGDAIPTEENGFPEPPAPPAPPGAELDGGSANQPKELDSSNVPPSELAGTYQPYKDNVGGQAPVELMGSTGTTRVHELPGPDVR